MDVCDLPLIFSVAIIMGEFGVAVAWDNRQDFMFKLTGCRTDDPHINKVMPQDNVARLMGEATGSLILTHTSREAVIAALRHRSQQHDLLNCLQSALDDTLSDRVRIMALQAAQQTGPNPEALAFARTRLISGDHSRHSNPTSAIQLCRAHGCEAFIPVFDALAEALPYLPMASNVFRWSIAASCNVITANYLLDAGVLAEGIAGMARNDFSGLDRLTERLAVDPNLTSISSDFPRIMTEYSRKLRIAHLGTPSRIPKPPSLTWMG